MVGHTCNLSYLGGRDQEDHNLGQPGQKFVRLPSQPTNVVGCASDPRYMEDFSLRPALGKSMRPYQKNNQSKKRWGYGLSSRTPAWQAQGSDFQTSQPPKKIAGPLKNKCFRALWHTSIILALWRLRPEDCELEASRRGFKSQVQQVFCWLCDLELVT
jgi:hypothetical protein